MPETLDLCDSGSVLYHLSYKSNEDKSLDLIEFRFVKNPSKDDHKIMNV